MSIGLISAPVPITTDHDGSGFRCGERALDEWLNTRALKNESRFTRTFVACEDRRIRGFYALAAASIRRDASPGWLRRNAPDDIPAIVIARLATDVAVAGTGLGSSLLADALRRIGAVQQQIGVAVVLVHAKSDAARRFYQARANFAEFPADSRTLFLRADSIIAEQSA